MNRTLEIMAPAGSWEMLEAAIAAGADSVYFGASRFNLRANHPVNFSDENIPRVIDCAHRHGVRAYFLANTLPTSLQLDDYFAMLDYVAQYQPDGFVVSSIGVMREVARTCAIDIIASVWAGVSNGYAAAFSACLGVKEVTAARQMTLDEISRLTTDSGNSVKVRIFVAGNWCAQLDGRCYMNSYTSRGRIHTDGCCGPNCDTTVNTSSLTSSNPCRLPWLVRNQTRKSYSQFFMQAPGEQIGVSLKACQMAGIDGLKINGRARSSQFVRKAIWRIKQACAEIETCGEVLTAAPLGESR